MANRVTEAEVKAILDNTTLTNTQVLAYIGSANTLINTVFGTGTTAILGELEKWVAAHMIAITRERQAKKEEAGGAKIEYTGVYEEGLKSTSYGQMAIFLDSTGLLAALSGKTIKIYAIPSFN